ncbi:MAG TPA: hypothetical protein V6C97_16060 [Oculatellaceae cyanobacterium]
MIKRIALSFVISLCIAGLSLHFAVESLGGMQDHVMGGQVRETAHSHEGDQFVLSEPKLGNASQEGIFQLFTAWLKVVSRPLHPILQPPKSI